MEAYDAALFPVNCDNTGTSATPSDASSCSYMGLFYVRRTLLQMLRDRGYAISGVDLTMDMERFRAVFGDDPARQNLTIRSRHRSSISDKVPLSSLLHARYLFVG
jgi:DNA-directed RNA polymerase I, II, and III subunit RPABC1